MNKRDYKLIHNTLPKNQKQKVQSGGSSGVTKDYVDNQDSSVLSAAKNYTNQEVEAKQDKTDNNLITDSKEIVGGINEVKSDTISLSTSLQNYQKTVQQEFAALEENIGNAFEHYDEIKQNTLTAGDNITIVNDVISSTTEPITVDSALSTTSTNPVENRVVTKAINDTRTAVDTNRNSILSVAGEVDQIEYDQREIYYINSQADYDYLVNNQSVMSTKKVIYFNADIVAKADQPQITFGYIARIEGNMHNFDISNWNLERANFWIGASGSYRTSIYNLKVRGTLQMRHNSMYQSLFTTFREVNNCFFDITFTGTSTDFVVPSFPILVNASTINSSTFYLTGNYTGSATTYSLSGCNVIGSAFQFRGSAVNLVTNSGAFNSCTFDFLNPTKQYFYNAQYINACSFNVSYTESSTEFYQIVGGCLNMANIWASVNYPETTTRITRPCRLFYNTNISGLYLQLKGNGINTNTTYLVSGQTLSNVHVKCFDRVNGADETMKPSYFPVGGLLQSYSGMNNVRLELESGITEFESRSNLFYSSINVLNVNMPKSITNLYRSNSETMTTIEEGVFNAVKDDYSYRTDGKYGLNMNNSDAIGFNTIWFADTATGASEGLIFPRGVANTYDTFRVNDGKVYLDINWNKDTGTASTTHTLLTNKGNQSIAGNLYPSVNTAYDLGGSTYEWRNIYVDRAYISTNLYTPALNVTGNSSIQHTFPRVTNTYDLGSNSYKWRSVSAVDFYEKGQTLTSRYAPLSLSTTKQDKTDSALNTSNKTVVGAINENKETIDGLDNLVGDLNRNMTQTPSQYQRLGYSYTGGSGSGQYVVNGGFIVHRAISDEDGNNIKSTYAPISLSTTKQDKTDTSLMTTSKTVVGAINENGSRINALDNQLGTIRTNTFFPTINGDTKTLYWTDSGGSGSSGWFANGGFQVHSAINDEDGNNIKTTYATKSEISGSTVHEQTDAASLVVNLTTNKSIRGIIRPEVPSEEFTIRFKQGNTALNTFVIDEISSLSFEVRKIGNYYIAYLTYRNNSGTIHTVEVTAYNLNSVDFTISPFYEPFHYSYSVG